MPSMSSNEKYDAIVKMLMELKAFAMVVYRPKAEKVVEMLKERPIVVVKKPNGRTTVYVAPWLADKIKAIDKTAVIKTTVGNRYTVWRLTQSIAAPLIKALRRTRRL